ncbi:hypothetical protein AALP_AA6G290700 [Arabis alpina]|uniref:Uncharacterized protein n=1 Tax=Arabis alpina TaxID=50452 RepID=A0A087GSF6_ARAAL|nr:hypothetical protein AALP_AA6G290700 [Arabis alpina]
MSEFVTYGCNDDIFMIKSKVFLTLNERSAKNVEPERSYGACH